MKIKNLLEYTNLSTVDFLNDETINDVKNHSTKFINEFLKKGITVYRGSDDISPYELHVVPTKAHREAHGSIFYSNLLQTSLERYLKDHDIPSRYHHAVSTIAFNPSDFHGVDVEHWYYFIPKDDYRYHYYKNVYGGDINTEGSYSVHLSEIANDISRINRYIKELQFERDFIFNNVGDIFKDQDKEFVSKFFTLLDKVSDIVSHPFEISKEDIIFLDRIVNEADTLLDVQPSESIDSHTMTIYNDALTAFSILKSVLETDDIFTPIDAFRKSIVVDEITKEIKNSEIVFQCKEYYLIPMTELGDEFLRRLKE